MEFISAEEFLKQDKEAREVFLVYLDGENGLYLFNNGLAEIIEYGVIECQDEKCIPLFTEGQLRQFIEDNGYFITLNATSNTYDLFSLKTGRHCKAFEYREKTILETYWKVALKICEEELNNDTKQ
jgi:hypothetical protein